MLLGVNSDEDKESTMSESPGGTPPLKVLLICGSLRQRSFNRGLLKAAVEVAPPELSFTWFDRVGELPLYNADVEKDGDPEPVAALKFAVAAADVLLISTPEYNYGLPGGLKNAIDWASRPPATSVLKGKPVAIMGASGGRGGTIRAQLHLRQVFVFTETYAMVKPEILVATAAEKFDDAGRLADEQTRNFLTKFVAAIPAWARRFRN
jgi:chromate reductase, NAD(P)H dehydrogenase (quinone)